MDLYKFDEFKRVCAFTISSLIMFLFFSGHQATFCKNSFLYSMYLYKFGEFQCRWTSYSFLAKRIVFLLVVEIISEGSG